MPPLTQSNNGRASAQVGCLGPKGGICYIYYLHSCDPGPPVIRSFLCFCDASIQTCYCRLCTALGRCLFRSLRISPHLLRLQKPSVPSWHYPSPGVPPNPILRNIEFRDCWTHLRRPPGCMSFIYGSSDKGKVSLSRDCCKVVEALTSRYFVWIFTVKAFQFDFSQKVKDLQAERLLFQLPHLCNIKSIFMII
ncbi:hypothetical protein AXF42_Ash011646 [Apostasia shenzhenica]|uniref:Uncharacterized protein n=1 Tax=Apostasia shenzhenica TaxID=1088818 RepID=A0A2H9ZUJ7_9ASPA|nr:hypothetical protein AXF42_Ash011646 [Apostasia shenzhenica]